jgi:uncharacterized protein YjbI with pentapeptide repeats
MKTIKPMKQSLLYKVFEFDHRYHLAVAVLSFFPFEERPLGLLSEPDLWKFVVAELGKDAILDMCMPKPGGEVLVFGKCFAPGGKEMQAGEVRLRVGPVEKTLYVFGDRFWRRAGPVRRISDPLPFSEMAITWENAFGGPEYGKNPLGKGFAPVETETGETVHPLPNIEDPKHLIASPEDRPDPAGFGPYDLMWPQRHPKLGTYDEKWKREQFPGLALDLDWTFFNTAPSDQQIDGYFRGDEPLEVTGMHPEKPLVSAMLPGIRSRCFINRKTAEGEVFREIETRIDTVWLFPHAERGIVCYRGVAEVGDDEGDDVLQILVGYERLVDEARPLEHYRDVLARKTDPEKGVFELISEKGLVPDGEKSFFAELMEGEEKASYTGEDLLQKHARVRAQKELEKARDKMERLGLDPDLLPKSVPEPEEIDIEKMDMAAMIEKAEAEAKAKKAEVENRLREMCQKMGIDLDALLDKAQKKPSGLPKLDVEESIRTMRVLGVRNPELEEKMLRAEKTLKENYRHFAHLASAPPPLTEEDSTRVREEIARGCGEGRSFAKRDFSGADLSGLDLRGIDFREAILHGVDFSGSNIEEADLAGAILAHADLSGASLCRANLREANVGSADLSRADLSGADLTRAVLGKSQLERAVLIEAVLNESDLLEAQLEGVDFSRCRMKKVIFMNADLKGARFVGAKLGRCKFLKSNVEGADFTGVKGKGVIFIEVQGDGAVFKDAELPNLKAVSKSSFREANFQGAVLEQASFMEADLENADFSGAHLHRGNLMKSNLKNAILSRVYGVQALFLKADLTGARMTSSNLMQCSLRKARLVNADFRGSNLYEAEFLRAVLGKTDFTEANLKKTKLEIWAPSPHE